MFEFPMIDKAFIIDNASYSSFIKGLEYYKRDFVKKVSLQSENVLVAKVEGTKLYNVEIEFRPNGVNAHCDCPYEMDDYCKHIAAVMVYAMENIEKIRIESRNMSLAASSGSASIYEAIDRLLAEAEKKSRLRPAVAEFFKKNPDYFSKFQTYYEFMSAGGPANGRESVKKYSRSVEEHINNIRSDFEKNDFYMLENYMPVRNSRAMAGKDSISNYGAGEYSEFFERGVDGILTKYYSSVEEFLKIGDAIEAAKIILAVHGFARSFPAGFEAKLSKLEARPRKVLVNCVHFHASKAVKKLVEIAGMEESFGKTDGEWLYNQLLNIYFTTNFAETSRREKFMKLKFVCNHRDCAEYMYNFIIENLANNYNPMTGETFYITAENAHESFYLLNIAGEVGKAVKVAEKYWQQNILLLNEYIEFLMRNMEHRKAVKLSLEAVGMAERNPERQKSDGIFQDFEEFKNTLSTAVGIIDEVYSAMINAEASGQKKAMHVSTLYAAMYRGLVCTRELAFADRLINVIETAGKLDAEGHGIKHLHERVNFESFAQNLFREPVDDNFFVAKVFKKIGRDDLVIGVAERAPDYYSFIKIASLIMDSRPDETFELFKARIAKIISSKNDKNTYNHLARMLGIMGKIVSKSAEFKAYLVEIRSKYRVKKSLIDELAREGYAK